MEILGQERLFLELLRSSVSLTISTRFRQKCFVVFMLCSLLNLMVRGSSRSERPEILVAFG